MKTKTEFGAIQTITSFEESKEVIIENEQNKNGVRTVTLERDKSGFGFSFVGGLTANRALPFYIQSISIGGPAMKSKKLKPGDKIIELNAIKLFGMSHSAVLNIIKAEKDKLILTIETK
ncbi:hypothetical protein HZS_7659 [Henneguya salminicola]|nr:hypothetical protein HZS_7659 [Henneguya salminicola]